MSNSRTDDLQRGAIDTVMRVSHTLRREAKRRALTMAECAVMAFDLRLRDAGWVWGPDGPVPPPAVKGRIASLAKNPDAISDVRKPGWKLHRCADGEQCRAEISGGCAAGWCAHCDVQPDADGVPRFPVGM